MVQFVFFDRSSKGSSIENILLTLLPNQMKLFIHKNGLNFRDGTQNGNKRSQLVRGELGAKDGSLKDSVGSDHDNRGSVPRHQNRDYEISSFWDVVRSKRFMDDG